MPVSFWKPALLRLKGKVQSGMIDAFLGKNAAHVAAEESFAVLPIGGIGRIGIDGVLSAGKIRGVEICQPCGHGACLAVACQLSGGLSAGRGGEERCGILPEGKQIFVCLAVCGGPAAHVDWFGGVRCMILCDLNHAVLTGGNGEG